MGEFFDQLLESRQASQLGSMLIDVSFEVLEAVHDDGEIAGEEFLVKETVNFDSHSVLYGDLRKFVHC